MYSMYSPQHHNPHPYVSSSSLSQPNVLLQFSYMQPG